MQLVLDSFSLSLSLNQLSKSCFFERPAQNMLVKCSQWLATGPGPSGGLRAYVAYKSQKENQDIYNGYCDVNYRGTSGFGFDHPTAKKPWCFRAGAGPSTCRGSPGGCGCGGATAPQEVPDCDCYAYPLVMTNSLLLKMAHRNLDLWIYLVKMVIFHSYVNVYQRVYVDKYD